MTTRLPDPALVVLVGAAGSGKSTWAAARYRAEEVVSSDTLRGIAGSGPHDLDASDDAFALLERIVDARLGRGLTTVVDTLGLDDARRSRWLAAARSAGLPAVAVVHDTPAPECRRRNATRERPVPAPALAGQLKRVPVVRRSLETEGWDVVHIVSRDEPRVPEDAAGRDVGHTPRQSEERRSSQGLRIVLQVSRFPWGEEPTAWLTGIARAADDAGLAGIALMDHLVQIPQVGRAWDPIPEPWVTLGMLAGLGTNLDLGTLVTPVSFRPAGIIAKHAATLDVLSGGRAFVGLGAGWWDREHAGFGIPFPPPRERVDAVEAAVETMRALWGSGTKAYAGERVSLPETTNYPRPAHDIPVIVGGSGDRMLRIGARLGDAVNVRTELVGKALEAVTGTDVKVTILDLPVIGRDRDDAWARVERLRGRTAAATYAARTNAGTPAEQRDRYGALADRGVDTVFVALADLDGPEDVERLAPLAR
ncbi:alkanesulfonate monooxygenase SsuD/methylene tetrahydromethanopterin reductase-like flavin-dependent oxidoreductase (luciferase family)/predicted kinase [Nocardioides ginsengisegetis]|uniref:Alkanesulfonate monooxygenase SsuD/methylene tetrahydromethanopterin reductase-like flavin-dependent oxidoreductase (Luciferase family)/predicted kinase n=1 Tax=Nocardioides ginsengisegetis TaxID=661491 RepID=A0A7W3IZQ3_9ACTN|nr:alkanesulfonate monooxygenase SsuD/methylene tetrahydromethanopterin reductase-like flavin-dependent oxidoreductase (luciferase family)/predicted kinase [Nocardioides ginsengisegetis]